MWRPPYLVTRLARHTSESVSEHASNFVSQAARSSNALPSRGAPPPPVVPATLFFVLDATSLPHYCRGEREGAGMIDGSRSPPKSQHRGCSPDARMTVCLYRLLQKAGWRIFRSRMISGAHEGAASEVVVLTEKAQTVARKPAVWCACSGMCRLAKSIKHRSFCRKYRWAVRAEEGGSRIFEM